MRRKRTLFCLLLLGLIFPSALTEDLYWEEGDVGTFAQKKCTQKENHQILCADVKEEASESRWPIGTYVLPKSRFGCPESYVRGWREGYLSLTWRIPRAVYVDDGTNVLDLTQFNQPSNIGRHIVFGQATRSILKIHFCYKHRHESLLDVGVWPNGNYSIYGTNNSCPDDFESDLLNITLPEVSRWQKHGYTPDMEIFMGDPTTIRIRICTKTSAESVMNEMFLPKNNDLSTFVLLKNNDDGACPVIQNTIVDENILYIQQHEEEIHINIKFQALCSYEPHWNTSYSGDENELRGKRIITAYSVYIANVTKGFARSGDYVRHTEVQESTAVFFQDILRYRHFRISVAWIIVDLARSVSVSAVAGYVRPSTLYNYAGDIGLIPNFKLFSRNYLVDCTIGNDKWAFFYSNVVLCNRDYFYDSKNMSFEILLPRDMEGRFITLFEEKEDAIYADVSSIEVFTKHVKYDSTENCNMDLGMTGLEITDEAISASSWLDDFPPSNSRPYSSGWCADINDGEPYIQIELPTAMVIEGITIYNWKSLYLLNQSMLDSEFVSFGVRAFSMFYKVGNQTGSYDGIEKFYIDSSQPVTAPQMFWFKEKIEADSVRILISEPLTAGLNCLRFELHGCKITGLYKLVNTMTNVRQRENEVVSFINEMFEDIMRISSLGYPLRYGGQSYIWIIKLPEQRFIKLRFLDISLGYFQDETSPCNDTIAISRDLHDTGKPRVIDYTFIIEEENTLSVDTSVTSLVMSYRTCTATSQSSDTRGFETFLKSYLECRGVVKTDTRYALYLQYFILKEYIPSCFSLHETIPWHLGLHETCRQPAMMLTSMTFLGFPFRKTNEEWTIHVPLHQIHLQILQFIVYCLVDFSPSRFTVIDLDKERAYCNFNRPPDLIISASDKLTVSFYKGPDPREDLNLFREGFRLVYTSSRDKMEYLISHHKFYSDVRNIALGKPAIMSSGEFHAGLATDGIVQQELGSGSCFQTSFEYEPWWMVDLQGIYQLEYVVLYNIMDSEVSSGTKMANIFYGDRDIANRNIQISTGLSVYKLQRSGHICTRLRKIETINQSGIIARYVRLTALQYTDRLSLCEVQIYGHLVQEHSTEEEPFTFPRKIHGNWGDWTSWENICYCNRTQIRRRECNSPRPDYGGDSCQGSDISRRYCKNDRGDCRLQDIAPNKPTLSSKKVDDKHYTQFVSGSLSVRGCYNAKKYIWTIVDLQGTFKLDRVLLHYRENAMIQTPREILLSKKYIIERLEILLGMTACDMKLHSFVCTSEHQGKDRLVVPLQGKTARFVEIESFPDFVFQSLCLELYGQEVLGDGDADKDPKCLQKQVAGNFSSWSAWSSCSRECGHGVSTRTRACSNPAPKNGGRNCFGETKEIQHCFGNKKCQVCSDSLGKCYSIFLATSAWDNARYECLIRQMQLVSIFSIEELRFIKTFLRQRRYLDGHPPINMFNASFYVHIGLRFVNPDKEYVPVWENNVRAHFLAWKPGHPSTSARACTRMNFQSFSDDNTWESVDCRTDLAEYLMCEHQMNGTNKDASSSNVVYRRNLVNVALTHSGKVCQRWDHQFPHTHLLYPKVVKSTTTFQKAIANNYCRDVWDNGYLWCFTTDPSTRWEACNVRNDITEERVCNIDIYNIGSKNVTTSGKTCLNWAKTLDDDKYRINHDVRTLQSFCRDPFYDGYSWCYVDTSFERGNISKEICDIEGGIESTQTRNDSIETLDFYCDGGTAVPYHLKCNGKLECKDQTDEIGCHWNYAANPIMSDFKDSGSNDSSLYFNGTLLLCPTNEWISIIALCDTVIDCFDASDEIGCDTPSANTNSMILSEQTLCKEDQFQCDDGDCVHVSQVCDFIPDCIDASDEYCEHDVCSSLDYKCDNGNCISFELRCDGVRHCISGSDEDNCDICQANTAFHCDILRCIPKRLQCDNYVDCEDGTDELYCTQFHKTCKEWWEAGYRQNGQYIIEGIRVKCDFDEYRNYGDGEIYTVVDSLDRRSQTIIGSSADMTDNVIYLASSNYSCLQQIKMVCIYSVRWWHSEFFDNCACMTYIFDPAYSTDVTELEPSDYENCDDTIVENRSVTHYSNDSFVRSMMLQITVDGESRFFRMQCYKGCGILQPGPAICNKTANADQVSDKFACAENGQVIPDSQKCLYDIDNAGFPLGCRDGSHLAKCEHFSCPNNTVKCPGSYCIPVRFVCDGDIHCEKGHDEENCGCDASQHEILILYEKGTANEQFIGQFSRQFYTPSSIVRILSFEVSKPLKSFGKDSTQLFVTDKQIDQRGDTARYPECSYKVMTKDFLMSVKFAKNTTKGLIYFQTSPISEEVADEMFMNLDDLNGDYKLYRVTQDLNTTHQSQRDIPKVTSVRVRRWKILTAIGAEYFGALCQGKAKMNCHGLYKCATSKTCIPRGQVCDGYRHCVHGDDELLCGFNCPNRCSCHGFYANCSATDYSVSEINDIPKITRKLDLSINKRLNSVLQEPVLDLIVLSFLNLSGCDITILSRHAFNRLRNLQVLDLTYNLITTLPDRVFSSLTHLRTLHLHGNFYLSTIHPNAFQNLFYIRELNLANSLLTKVSANTFAGLKLRSIDLSNNKLDDVEAFAFSNLSVNTINFEGNTIKQLNKETFTGVVDLKLLRTPAFKFCCIRPNYLDENNCFPKKDEFSSCEDLMRHSALQFLLWLIGVLSLLGNCLSLIYRLKVDRKRLKLGYGIFVTNLAVADLLMGAYLLIIAIADAAFRKRYIFEDDNWRGSSLCNLAGVLSTISSEASVFCLCLITIDRLLVIKFPFDKKFFTTKNSIISVVLAWLISLVIAVLPVVHVGYFQNKFYSRSGVCIALPLTRDRPPGWLYSVLVFVVFNFITFVLVAIGQWSIFYEMQKSSGMAATAQSSRKRDLKVARNLLLVVATDFMCWFPIGVIGAMALSGHAISGDVYAWAAVFILPVNSALNPILYTLTAIIGGQDFRPSTKEHSRQKNIKETGENVLNFHTVSRLLAHKEDFPSSKYWKDCKISASTYWSVYKISNENITIPLTVIIKSGAELAKLLDVMHCNCLGIKSMDAKSALFKVRNRKVLGDMKIKGEPYVSVKPEDKFDDIHRYGQLLRNISLLADR